MITEPTVISRLSGLHVKVDAVAGADIHAFLALRAFAATEAAVGGIARFAFGQGFFVGLETLDALVRLEFAQRGRRYGGAASGAGNNLLLVGHFQFQLKTNVERFALEHAVDVERGLAALPHGFDNDRRAEHGVAAGKDHRVRCLEGLLVDRDGFVAVQFQFVLERDGARRKADRHHDHVGGNLLFRTFGGGEAGHAAVFVKVDFVDLQHFEDAVAGIVGVDAFGGDAGVES